MKRSLSLLVLCIILALLFISPVSGQEATPETPPGDVTVPVDVVNNAQTANSVIIIAAGVILAIVGGGTFALVINRIDKRTKDETEKLYLALPPQWQDTIVRTLDAAEATLRLARELTDGQPNSDPPQPLQRK